MSIRTQLTIKDYLANAGLSAKRNLTANSNQDAGNSHFSRIFDKLASAQQSDAPADGAGLRIADYRKNPIRSRMGHSWPATPEPSAANAVHNQNVTPDSKPEPLPDAKQPTTGVSTRATAETTEPKPAAPSTQPHAGEALSDQIDGSIRKAARKYDLPPQLIRGVIQAESNYKPGAVSPAGAQGLMQLMPGTAKELGVTDPFDVDQNIDGGARYLRQMIDMFDGDLKRALAAYNAGPGTVLKHNGNVPYRETRAYVEKVMALAGRQTSVAAL